MLGKKNKKFLRDNKLNKSDSVGGENLSERVSVAEESILEGVWEIKFEGKGSELFGIFIDNFFLNLFTLGIYYPWAKAKKIRYFYSSTCINNGYFQFHGNGKEMFFGLIKALVVLFFLNFIYEAFIFGKAMDWKLLIGGIFYFLFFWLLIVIASIGTKRYRMSRTSWRGIRFRFEGTIKETTILIAKGWLINILTLGLYYPYYLNQFQAYWTSRSSFGNIDFNYDGQGKDVFQIWIKGILFSIITFGIYLFWLKANLHRYFWKHTMYSDTRIVSNLYGGIWLKESLIYILQVIFTFGFGMAWAEVRYKKFYLGTFMLEGKIDLNAIKQSEARRIGATGEGMADFFDVEI